jgi:hypothetical protein
MAASHKPQTWRCGGCPMWFGALCHVSHAMRALRSSPGASRLGSLPTRSPVLRVARACALKQLVCSRPGGQSFSIDYAEGATATPSCARQGKDKYPRLCPPCRIPYPHSPHTCNQLPNLDYCSCSYSATKLLVHPAA